MQEMSAQRGGRPRAMDHRERARRTRSHRGVQRSGGAADGDRDALEGSESLQPEGASAAPRASQVRAPRRRRRRRSRRRRGRRGGRQQRSSRTAQRQVRADEGDDGSPQDCATLGEDPDGNPPSSARAAAPGDAQDPNARARAAVQHFQALAMRLERSVAAERRETPVTSGTAMQPPEAEALLDAMDALDVDATFGRILEEVAPRDDSVRVAPQDD